MNDLVEVRKNPNKDLIGHLEGILEEAKKGVIQSVIEVVVFDDSTTASGHSIASHHMRQMAVIVAEAQMMIVKLCNHDTGIYRDIDRLKSN